MHDARPDGRRTQGSIALTLEKLSDTCGPPSLAIFVVAPAARWRNTPRPRDIQLCRAGHLSAADHQNPLSRIRDSNQQAAVIKRGGDVE